MVCCLSLALKPLYVKDGYHVNCTVSSNFLLDKGRVAKNLQKECFCYFITFSELLPKFGEKLFQGYVSEGISHPVLYGDQVYKLKRQSELRLVGLQNS